MTTQEGTYVKQDFRLSATAALHSSSIFVFDGFPVIVAVVAAVKITSLFS